MSFMYHAQVAAVCDVDSKRMNHARHMVEARYGKKKRSGTYKGCAAYKDFRELIARDDIDTVCVATPDHWHVPIALAAARAGKDIFLQKPVSLTIEEGRILSDTVRRYGRVLQVGTQYRSMPHVRFGCELVRNGRIGKLHTVRVSFGGDPSCKPQPVMPVPRNLDYDMWLGPAPWAPYTERRVHPQKGHGRPGWLRVSDYCWGQIAGNGSHFFSMAHWGMDTDHTGPVELEGSATFPKDGLWDVHGRCKVTYKYPNGVTLIYSSSGRAGVRFEGTEGWIHMYPGFDAHPKSLLKSKIRANEIRLYESRSHPGNFIECVKTRAETVAPVETAGHRTCSACILGGIAMRLQRKLKWDPEKERFINDAEANRMLSRPMRGPWQL
jgi:predicted dehydrogenase